MKYEELGQDLVRSVPDFQNSYKEHLADYDEVLPHVLLADLMRHLVSIYRGSGSHDVGVRLIEPALDWLEQGMASNDPRVPEAIVVSFLENLEKDEDGRKIASVLGPRLKAALTAMSATS